MEIDAVMLRTGVEGGGARALRYLLRELVAIPPSNLSDSTLSARDRDRLDAEGFTVESDDERAADRPDPVLRGATHRAAVLGTALPPEDVARGLGRSVTRIYHMLAERQLYGVRDGRQWRLPRFQFVLDGDRISLVPGVTTLFPRVERDFSVAAVANWFTLVVQPGLVLGGTPSAPRDWLLAGGDPGRVAPPELLFM